MARFVLNDRRWTTCPLCESPMITRVGAVTSPKQTFSSSPVHLERTPELWRCAHCHSRFIQNAVPEPIARELYASGTGASWQSARFEDEKPELLVSAVAARVSPTSTVLDVGCNTGELLDFIHGITPHTHGVELSAHARNVTSEKGHRVFASLDAIPIDMTFDVICAFDLVEHLYDVGTFLDACRSRLAPYGILIILTGNPDCLSARCAGARWWYASHPEHVVFPSRYYFSNVPLLKLESYLPTFNARAHHADWIFSSLVRFPKRAAKFCRDMAAKIYGGDWPRLDTDHALVVLRNDVATNSSHVDVAIARAPQHQ